MNKSTNMGRWSNIVTQFSSFTLAILLLVTRPAAAYFISIDANEEQCFFDRVVAGQTMGLMFEVAEGGFLDIDVKVSQSIIMSVYGQRTYDM